MRTRNLVWVVGLLIASASVVSAQVSEEWVARYNGPVNGWDEARAIALDADGNVYVTGRSEQLGKFPFNPDYATIKYDADGNELWVERYNGPGNGWDEARAIALDADGNVYVTGWSSGAGTGADYATIKYDPDGNPFWVARYNGPENLHDGATAIAVDADKNVYVTGWTCIQQEFKGCITEYATVKYDAAGNQLWVARYGPVGHRIGSQDAAIVVDADSNVYVAGTTSGGVTGDDYATIKYDADGNELWVARYNGPGNGGDIATAIALDAAGHVYVTGYSMGTGTFFDYATVKYDAAGNELWVARYDGPGRNHWDQASAIALDADGNVYVTGWSEGVGTGGDYATVKYDAAGNELWVARYGPVVGLRIGSRDTAIAVDADSNVYVTGTGWGGVTGDDYATIKYDADGSELWVAHYDGPGNSIDEAKAIALDADGNVYVTGGSSGVGTGGDYATIKYAKE